MNASEDRSKALNEHMSSGFAPRADIVAACRHVRFVPKAAVSNRSKMRGQSQNYSITSSAIESTPGGTSMPSARAVCRLMTNSNLINCSTGRSAGLAPLRMWPV
jgi:hypothetical protein